MFDAYFNRLARHADDHARDSARMAQQNREDRMKYIIFNGRKYYLDNCYSGFAPFAWVDDFGNNAVCNGDYAWNSSISAIRAANKSDFDVFDGTAPVMVSEAHCYA